LGKAYTYLRWMFPYAGQADIYRAVLKDVQLLRSLRNEIKDLAYSILGGRAQALDHLFEASASAAYYSLSTLRGGPTLGEEYTDIMPLNSSFGCLSGSQKIALVACQVLGPLIYNHLRDHTQLRPPQPNPVLNAATTLWNNLLGLVKGSALMQLERVHLMLFFLFGTYLQLSYRAAGVRYIFLRKLSQARPGYQILGVLMFIQFGIGAMLAVKHHLARQRPLIRDEGDEGLEIIAAEEEEDSNASCGLCFCSRTSPTVTECGHLFCWQCIGLCLTNKPECPMCRQPCALSSLVRLNNYKKAVA